MVDDTVAAMDVSTIKESAMDVSDMKESGKKEPLLTDNETEHKASGMDQQEADTPKKKGLAALWQLIKFGMVGVVNTLVSMMVYNVTYYLLKHVVQETIAMQIGNVLGFIISVLNAYIQQSRLVFKETEDGEHRVWWKVLIKTYIAYSFTGLFLTSVLLLFWSNVVHIEQYLGGLSLWVNSHFSMNLTAVDLGASLAPFLNMVITIPINFLINKFWAYRQKKKEPVEEA